MISNIYEIKILNFEWRKFLYYLFEKCVKLYIPIVHMWFHCGVVAAVHCINGFKLGNGATITQRWFRVNDACL